jgi:heme-degrading monooxygenase HmoA
MDSADHTGGAGHRNRARACNAGAPDPWMVLAHGGAGEDRDMVMIVTMVAVAPGREEEWEAVWHQFRTAPAGYPGFRRMTLLRDSTRPGHYIVQSEWDSRFGFEQFLRISGVEWLNRGPGLWTAAPPLVYDEVVDVVQSEMSKES